MSGHTPGPWGNDRKPVLVRGCTWLAHAHFDTDEGTANARLISAAPDMLEALEIAAPILEQYADFVRLDVRADDLERHPYQPAIEEAAERARAAIAKARGDAA